MRRNVGRREKEQSQLAARKAFVLDGEGRMVADFNEKRCSEIYKSLVTRQDGFKLRDLRRRELSFLDSSRATRQSFAKRGINFSKEREGGRRGKVARIDR